MDDKPTADRIPPRRKPSTELPPATPVSAAGRQDGNYTPRNFKPGKGGPVPPYKPIDEPTAATGTATDSGTPAT